MELQQTDFQILKDIFHEYILGIKEIRSMMIPSLGMMALSRYLQVLVSRLVEKLSTSIKTEVNLASSLFIYSTVYITSILLVELSSLYLCKAGRIGYRVANRNTYHYFLDLSPKSFRAVGKGEIQNTISRKSQAIQDIIDVITLMIMPISLTILFASIQIINSLGLFPLIIILASLVVYTIVTIKITVWRNKMRLSLNKTSDISSNLLVDGLNNFETIFANNTDQYEIDRYEAALKTVQHHNIGLHRSMYLLNISQGLIWGIQAILVIGILSYGIFVQKMDPSQFNFFLSITATFHVSMFNLGGIYGRYKAGMLNIRLTNLPPRFKRTEGFQSMYNFYNKFTVSNMTFAYQNKVILDNASFEILKGEKVAIIGQNGVGKSTLIKSLIGINESDAEIYFDDTHVNELTDQSLRHMISYVSQSAILFDESVIYNIKYGNAKIFDDQIFSLSKKLGLHESLTKLEHGYNTRCGENGSSLSGGERQKILILRSLLREAPILLMDEPTASLDKHSEYHILKCILSLEEMTVVTIIHNLHLLSMFDKVLLIENQGIKVLSPGDVDQSSMLKIH